MTIEEKMEHFRSLSLESANSKSAESLSSYKDSLNEELEIHKETAIQLAEESKKALLNQVRASSKKELASAQMMIKKELMQRQSYIKAKTFDIVRQKITDFRKSSDYADLLIRQIHDVMHEYNEYDITIYIDPDDNNLLEKLKSETGGNIKIYNKEFLGGTRTIVPERNILIDNSFKTRLSDEQDQFTITLQEAPN